MRHVGHVFQIVQPGDYCFVVGIDGSMQTILSCPICGQAMLCRHEVKMRDPLTLSPSVVGPGELLHCSCEHHFFVNEGKVTLA